MAGIAGLRFNPLPSSSPATAASSPFKPMSRVRLPVRFWEKPVGGCPTLTVGRVAAKARFGGGYYRPKPGPGNSRRMPGDAPLPDPDYDPALDLDRVKSSSVRLLDEQQNMIGVMSKREAMQMAENAELVLAIMSIDADPPVLRLFSESDYKKHKYEQQKKKKEQQKRSAASRMDIKEVKMGYNIDSHDYSVRLKAAQKFLKDGDKVKVIVNLKRRENEFKNFAIELIKRFQNDIGELATEESKNFSEKNLFIVLMPNKAVKQKLQEQPRKKEIPVTEISASV